MNSKNLARGSTDSTTRNPLPFINESATGPLVKQLITIAEREEELLRKLADAIALDCTDAIIAIARKLVAGHRHQRPEEAENCADLVE